MNKKIITPLIVLGMIAFVVAGITYYGQVQRNVHIDRAVIFEGDNSADTSVAGGESVISDDLSIYSQTSVVVPISIMTTHTMECNIEDTTNYLLNADGEVGTESRIYITSEDAGISTLNDLESIEWETNVNSGYLPHVDVLIDTDGDGVKDDALVFEYAKVSAPYDNSPYPIGEMNTFGDKGMVDNDARAWLSSGSAGDISNPAFIDGLLSEWKSGTADDTSINGNTKIVGFDLEIDNWILDSNSEVRNIRINGNSIEVSLKPEDYLNFNVNSEYGFLCEGEDTITTTATTR